MKNSLQKLALISIVAAFTQCSSDNDKQKASGSADSSNQKQAPVLEPFTADEAAVFKFDLVLANLPSPMEVYNDLNKSKINFSQQLITDEKKFQSATSAQQKSLFMGAYSIDLGYCINYNQNQLALNYMASLKKLSDDLSLSRFYGQSFMERFNKNIEHRDSLMQMTNEVFSITDKYLRSNDQLKSAVLILAGSWIESIFLCSEIAKNSPKSEANALIYTRLWNQRLHLKQLLEALEPFKNEPTFNKIVPAFNEILAICNKTGSMEEFTMEHANAIAEKTQKLHSELF